MGLNFKRCTYWYWEIKSFVLSLSCTVSLNCDWECVSLAAIAIANDQASLLCWDICLVTLQQCFGSDMEHNKNVSPLLELSNRLEFTFFSVLQHKSSAKDQKINVLGRFFHYKLIYFLSKILQWEPRRAFLFCARS